MTSDGTIDRMGEEQRARFTGEQDHDEDGGPEIESRADLVRHLRTYAQVGVMVEQRYRCEMAAQTVEQGGDLIGLRDQLSLETSQGDVSMIALAYVNYAIWEGVR